MSRFTGFIVGVAILMLSMVSAEAHILVSPLRVVLTDSTEATDVEIRNQSDRLLDVQLNWIELNALEEGGYGPASTSDIKENAASPFLSIEPSRALIPPGEAITARIRLIKNTPAAGERRSHLLIEAAPPADAVRNAGMSEVPLDMTLGISIPVMLRVGNGDSSAKIAGAEFTRDTDGNLVLHAEIQGSGVFSSFGTFKVIWREREKATEELLGELENLAVYKDTGRRRVSIPLKIDTMDGGVLELVYEGRDEYKDQIFDTREFTIEPEDVSSEDMAQTSDEHNSTLENEDQPISKSERSVTDQN